MNAKYNLCITSWTCCFFDLIAPGPSSIENSCGFSYAVSNFCNVKSLKSFSWIFPYPLNLFIVYFVSIILKPSFRQYDNIVWLKTFSTNEFFMSGDRWNLIWVWHLWIWNNLRLHSSFCIFFCEAVVKDKNNIQNLFSTKLQEICYESSLSFLRSWCWHNHWFEA